MRELHRATPPRGIITTSRRDYASRDDAITSPGPVPLCPRGPFSATLSATSLGVTAQRKGGPNRCFRPVLTCVNAPTERQSVNDSEPAPAERVGRRLVHHGHGRAAAVTHSNLNKFVAQHPRHLDEAARQRCGVAQRVADEFTQDEAGVTRRSLIDASPGEVADQTSARYANARGCIREHPHARRTHLHEHPAPSVELYEPGMSGNAPCAHRETVNSRFPECYVPQCPGLLPINTHVRSRRR